MARLLIAADLLLDSPLGGLADVTIDVANAARRAPFEALEAFVDVAVGAEVDMVCFAGASAAATRVGRAGLDASIRRLHDAGIAVLGPLPAAGPEGGATATIGGLEVVLRPSDGRSRGDVYLNGPTGQLAHVFVDNATMFAAGRGRVGALQPRAQLQGDDEAGALLLDVAAGGPTAAGPTAGGPAGASVTGRVIACHRLESVLVPVIAGASVRRLDDLARLLAHEAPRWSAARPGRLLVAHARLHGPLELRRQLAVPGAISQALQLARAETARAGAPLWWERIDLAPRVATVLPAQADPVTQADAATKADALAHDDTDLAHLLATRGPHVAVGVSGWGTDEERLAAWLGPALAGNARAILARTAINPLAVSAEAMAAARSLAMDLIEDDQPDPRSTGGRG